MRVGDLPEVWLADEATRQLRRLVRYRAGLVEQKKDIKLRIGALLREERVVNTSGANTWAKPWMAWLKSVKLGEQSRWVLDQELRRLEQAEQDLAGVEQRMEQATQGDAVVEKLKEQAGIGPVTAVTMRAGHRPKGGPVALTASIPANSCHVTAASHPAIRRAANGSPTRD